MRRDVRIRQPRGLPIGQLPRPRRWPWLVALLALVLALGRYALERHSSVQAADRTPRSFTAPRGSRLTTARCIIVVIDESSSMTTSDPSGLRARAIDETVRFLVSFGLPGDEIGGGWFADTSSYADPVVVSKAASTWVPPNLGGSTNMTGALADVAPVLERCTAQPVLLLVTDGQADDLEVVRQRIHALPPDVRIHLVAMNVDGGYVSVAPFWEDPSLGIDSVERIDEVRPVAVARAVADILERETGQQIGVA